MEKIKVGLYKWIFKRKLWVGGNIMIISQDTLYSDVLHDI